MINLKINIYFFTQPYSSPNQNELEIFFNLFFFCIIHHTPLPWWSHYLQCPSFGEDDRKALKTACTTSSFSFLRWLASLPVMNLIMFNYLRDAAVQRELHSDLWGDASENTVNTQHPLGCFIKATRGLVEVWRWVCRIFVWIPGVCLHVSTLHFL